MDPEGYRRFPREALFDPLGMTTTVLETDVSGPFASSFIYATAKAWARFGMLYLHDGVWNGDRILPDGWIEYTRTAATMDTGKVYGDYLWVEIPDEFNLTQRASRANTIHAVGHEGQFVTIVPSYDAVIVRLSKTRSADAWDHGSYARSVPSALKTGE